MVKDLVFDYYALLRSLAKTRPNLKQCLVRCRHCSIYFFAHPRNVSRSTGCPFGCAQEFRRREGSRRSKEFYQDDNGKLRKSRLNQWRKLKASPGDPPAPSLPPTQFCEVSLPGIVSQSACPADSSPSDKLPDVPQPKAFQSAKDLPALLIGYVQRVVSEIEGWRMGRKEILAMLDEEMRQRSMVRKGRREQIIGALHERPP